MARKGVKLKTLTEQIKDAKIVNSEDDNKINKW